MIDILCPTRSRPSLCKRMMESALKTAYWPEKIYFRLAVDMEQSQLYSGIYNPSNMTMYEVCDWGIVQSVNMMAQDAMAKSHVNLFMIAADDTIFTTPHWDKALVEHYEALENKVHVYCLQDSRDKDGTPHPCLTRQYINSMGYFFPPIFLHWYVDIWTAEIAKANNVFTYMRDYELQHLKPSDSGAIDETHMRVRNRGWHVRDTFVANQCRHFLEEEKARLRKTILHQLGLTEHLE